MLSILWNIWELTVNVIDCTLILLLLTSSLKMKREGKLWWVISLVVLVVICTLTNIYCNIVQTILVLTMALLLFTILFTTGSMQTKLFWAIFTQIIFFGVDILNNSWELLFLKGVDTSTITNPSSLRLFNMIVTRSILIVIVFWLRRRKLLFASFSTIQSIALLLCPLLSWASILSIAKLLFLDKVSGLFALLSTFLTCAINVVYIFLFMSIRKTDDQLRDALLMQQKQEFEKEHYESIIENNNTLQTWRHDIKNHFQTIMELAKNADDDKLIEYVTNIDETLFTESVNISTGNYAMDAILGAKVKKALNNSISVSINLIVPELSFIAGPDLSRILGNIWDNAIEGCMRSNAAEKYIKMTSNIQRRYFIIDVTNSSDNLTGSELKTSKDSNLHGIGLKSIKSALDSYNGIYDFSPHDDHFTTRIGIPLGNVDIKSLQTHFFSWSNINDQ